MHKYNNQDHSMMTALLASRNIANANNSAAPQFDTWKVNTDAEYHEEETEASRADAKKSGRLAPQKIAS